MQAEEAGATAAAVVPEEEAEALRVRVAGLEGELQVRAGRVLAAVEANANPSLHSPIHQSLPPTPPNRTAARRWRPWSAASGS